MFVSTMTAIGVARRWPRRVIKRRRDTLYEFGGTSAETADMELPPRLSLGYLTSPSNPSGGNRGGQPGSSLTLRLV